MQTINKNKYTILILLIAYLSLRLSSLFTIPFMQDEAEYLFWAKNIIADPSQFLMPLSMGVKPLYTWLEIPFLLTGHILEIHEARMVSLIAGIFTMLALYLLSNELFKNKKIGLLAVIIYIFWPYAQIYNSVSVFEGTVGAFILFTLLLSIKLIKNPKLVYAIGFGSLLGFGLLTKKHAAFNAYLLPFSFLYLPIKTLSFKNVKKIVLHKDFKKIILLFLLAFIIAIGMQQILKLSPDFKRIAWYEGGTIYTKKTWLMMSFAKKLSVFTANSTMWSKIYTNVTLPYWLLLGYSLTLFKKYWKAFIILFAYFLIPALALAFFGTRAADHWIYPMPLTLIPLIALGLYLIGEKIEGIIAKNNKFKKKIKYAIYALFIIYPAYFIFMIIFNPLSSPLPLSEKYHFYVCQMEMFLPDVPMLNKIATYKKIVIGTENDKGFKNFMAVNLWNDKNIMVNGYWSKHKEIPIDLEKASYKMPAYYARITYKYENFNYDPPSNVPIKLLSKRISNTGICTYRLYKINSKLTYNK